MVAACLVVRSERSLAPERISPVAVRSDREVSRSCVTTSLSLSPTALVSCLSRAKAPAYWPCMRRVRSVLAIAASTSPVSLRPRSTVSTSALTLRARLTKDGSANSVVIRLLKSPSTAAPTTSVSCSLRALPSLTRSAFCSATWLASRASAVRATIISLKATRTPASSAISEIQFLMLVFTSISPADSRRKPSVIAASGLRKRIVLSPSVAIAMSTVKAKPPHTTRPASWAAAAEFASTSWLAASMASDTSDILPSSAWKVPSKLTR